MMLSAPDGLTLDDIGVVIIIDDVLEQLRVVSFEVSPSTIGPQEEAIVSWEVTGPTDQVKLSLNTTSIAAQGSVTVKPATTGNPLSSRTYRLYAKRGTAVKQLSRIELAVDDSDCRQTAINRDLLETVLENQIAAQINRMNNFSLDGAVKVVQDEKGIAVRIPSEIKIDDYFNADTDIDIKLRVFSRRDNGNRRVAVNVESVDVDVIWAWGEHVLSLIIPGCTGILQAAMQRLLDVCITNMLASQIEEQLASQLQAIVDQVLEHWQGIDPNERKYLLTTLFASVGGIEIVACPEPADVPPPELVEDFDGTFDTIVTDDGN